MLLYIVVLLFVFQIMVMVRFDGVDKKLDELKKK